MNHSKPYLLVLATLSGVVFPLSLVAQETVIRGNEKTPLVVPGWFSRMAKTPERYAPEIDRFIIPEPHQSSYGRPSPGGEKYACNPQIENGRVTWQFCEM